MKNIEKVIFATGNLGKLKEVKHIFEDVEIEISSLADLDDPPEIIEDCDTFRENAYIKAETIFKKYRIPVFADDSGLAVEQLNGEPGIYSARYAFEGCTYDDNNRKLLKELKTFEPPHPAKFICCAAFVSESLKFDVSGELPGEIIHEFRGVNGFGYDPIFVPENYSETLAEIGLSEKNKISHRARAFHKLKSELIKRNVI